ncbi:glycosyltransferase family A protein [Echinicola sediminis]
MLDYCVIVPAHNEEKFLPGMLDSLMKQSHLPSQVVLVNDNSTDQTASIIDKYCEKYPVFKKVNTSANHARLPGSKVVAAFQLGLKEVDRPFDFMVKLDADLILPENYFQSIAACFENDPKVGIAGGFAYEEENGEWKLHHTMNKDHVRGAFKSYVKDCFEKMGGLRSTMGWDTVDELLARYHGYKVVTLEQLKVKHLRPTASSYSQRAKYMQGEAMYRMRYDIGIALLTMIKVSWKQGKISYLKDSFIGYLKSHFNGTTRAVTAPEGKFIRQYRWKNIFQKLSGK